MIKGAPLFLPSLRGKQGPARKAGGRMRGHTDLSAFLQAAAARFGRAGATPHPPIALQWAPPSPTGGEGVARLRRAITALAAVACIGAAADPAERLPDPAQEAHARALFQQVRCVVCQNESIDDSEAQVAGDLRRAIREQVAEGRSDEQIRSFLVARYGEFVLLRPRLTAGNAILWLAPFLVALGGVGVFAWRARRTAQVQTDELTPAEQARLHQLEGR